MRPDTFTKPLYLRTYNARDQVILVAGVIAAPALSLPDAVQVLKCALVQPLAAHPASAVSASGQVLALCGR